MGLVIWWIVDAHFAVRAKTALEAIVRGIERTTGNSLVKANIADEARKTGKAKDVKNAVGRVKRKLGLT